MASPFFLVTIPTETTVQIQVWLTGGSDAQAANFTATFDPTLATFRAPAAGPTGWSTLANPIGGDILVGMFDSTLSSPVATTADGLLATLNFNIVSGATHFTLSLSELEITDSENNTTTPEAPTALDFIFFAISNDTADATEASGTANATPGVDPTGNVLSNDAGTGLTVTGVKTASTDGTIGSALAGQFGSLTLGSDGGFGYVVNQSDATVQALNTKGSVDDTFTYTVKDTTGATKTATLTITVHGADDAPVAASPGDQTGTVGSVLSIIVPAFADADDAANDITYAATLDDGSSLPAWLSFDAGTRTLGGTPPAGSAGTLTVKVTGTDPGTASDSTSFDLDIANPLIAVSADSASATEAGGTANGSGGSGASGNVLVNDTGTGLDVTGIKFGAATGTVGSPLAGGFGVLTIGGDGSFTYTPNQADATVQALGKGGSLSETFTYTVTDIAAQTKSTNLKITIKGSNDAPVASTPGDETGTVGTALAFTVAPFGDVDNVSDDITYTATLDDGSPLPAWLSFDAGKLAFSGTPPAGATGTLALKVTGTDPGALSASAGFDLTVSNPVLALTDDSGTAVEAGGVGNATKGKNVSGNVLTNDVGSGITVTGVSLGATSGTIGVNLIGVYGIMTLQANGSFTYGVVQVDPDTQALGSGDSPTETFTYSVTDIAGQTQSAHLAITVTGANDAPVASTPGDQSATVGSKFDLQVPAFTDVDNAAGDIAYVAVLNDGSPLPIWLDFDGTTRTFSGTPTVGSTGTNTVKVTGTDPGALSATASFNIDVANPLLTLSADSAAATEAGGVSNTVGGSDAVGNVLSNDTGLGMVVSGISLGATKGKVGELLLSAYGGIQIEADGSFLYSFAQEATAVQALTAGQKVSETFTYAVTDAVGQSQTQTLTINLTGANDAPTAFANGNADALVGSPFSLVINPFFDKDNTDSEITYTATLLDGSPLPAWLSLDGPTRSLTGTPPPGSNAVLDLKITGTDTGGLSDSTTFLLTVTCFAPGTRIRTDGGEVAVEHLRTGDLVHSVLRNRCVPVARVRQRTIDCARHPDPRLVWPVRIVAGAFGPGLPARDLLLSPDHAVYTGMAAGMVDTGVLVPVKHLINGSTVRQEPVDHITYYHVELDRHDVLLAEGLTAESYLSLCNEPAFDLSSRVVALHPGMAARVWEAEGCVELVVTGPAVAALRQRIEANRARALAADAAPASRRRRSTKTG